MGSRRSQGLFRRVMSGFMAVVLVLFTGIVAPAGAASSSNQSGPTASWDNESTAQDLTPGSDKSVSDHFPKFGSGFLAALFARLMEFKLTLEAALAHLWKLSHPGKGHVCN